MAKQESVLEDLNQFNYVSLQLLQQTSESACGKAFVILAQGAQKNAQNRTLGPPKRFAFPDQRFVGLTFSAHV